MDEGAPRMKNATSFGGAAESRASVPDLSKFCWKSQRLRMERVVICADP